MNLPTSGQEDAIIALIFLGILVIAGVIMGAICLLGGC
jgi:hypothetical protein